MTFTVMLANRSDYRLRVDAARLRLLDGTTFKSADNGGRLNSAGEASWDTIDVPAHGSVGPLTLVMDTTKLRAGTDVTGWVWVQFSHAHETAADGTILPLFTSSAVSKPASARFGGLQ